jgi:hypothetical protein
MSAWKELATRPDKDIIYLFQSGLLNSRVMDVIRDEIEASGNESLYDRILGKGPGAEKKYLIEDVILSAPDLKTLKSLYSSSSYNRTFLNRDDVLHRLAVRWLDEKTIINRSVYIPDRFDDFDSFVSWV